MRRRKCAYCSTLLFPDPRVGSRQKACRNSSCQAKRKKESQKKWSERNQDYWKIERGKNSKETKDDFRKEKASYMQDYRRKHPEYVKRDNERRNRTRREQKRAVNPLRRNQDERFVQLKEIERLIIDLIPCRNQDERCAHFIDNKGVTHDLTAP